MAIRVSASGTRVRRSADLPAETAWTTTLWFYPIDQSLAAGQPVQINIGTGNCSLIVLTTHLVRLQAGATQTNFSSVTTGGWYFGAIRQLSGNTKGYLWALGDATPATLEIAYAPASAISNIAWGSNMSGAWLNGRVAAIKLWDVALSDAEVANERFSILPRRGDGLNDFWPCFPGATERLAGYAKGRNLVADGSPTDEDPPPIGWGASPIIIGTAAAAAASYELTDYGFFHPDGVGV